MAYYSFYRMIKDILQTIFGKKFLRLFLIFVIVGGILFLFYPKKVKASDEIIIPVSRDDGETFNITLPNIITTNDYNFYFEGFINSGGYCGYTLYLSTGKIYINSNDHTLKTEVGASFYRLSGASSNSPNGSYIQQNINYRISNESPQIANSQSGFYGNYYGSLSCMNFDSNYSNYELNICSNTDIYNWNDKSAIVIESNYPFIKNPEILNSQNDFTTLLFDVVCINAGDYSTQDLYFLCYDKNYEGTDSLNNLYPIKEFLLNQSSKYFIPERTQDPTNGAIYWIDRTDIGFNWEIGNTYAFRFAIRTPVESEFTDWAYEYIADEFVFTVSSDVLQGQIDDLNQQTKEKEEQQRHEETISAIDRQTEQDNNFYNDILSNDYDEYQAGDTLDGITDSTSSIDNSEYIGLFSVVFGKFSNIINGNYNTVETISYPVMNTDESIFVSSDLLSSKIQGTFIYNFLQLFWYFLFGMYIFKFSNNLIRSIKSGSILNGYENNNEVITSTML